MSARRDRRWRKLAVSFVVPFMLSGVARADIRWLGGDGNWFDPQWEQPDGLPGPFFGVNQNVKIENGAVVTIAVDAGAIATLSIGGNAIKGGAVNQIDEVLRVSGEIAIGTQAGGNSQYILNGGLLDVGAGTIRADSAGAGKFVFTGGTLRVKDFDPTGFGAGLGGLKQDGLTTLLDVGMNNTTIHGDYQLRSGAARVGDGFKLKVTGEMIVNVATADVFGTLNAGNGFSVLSHFEKNSAGTFLIGGPQHSLPGSRMDLNGGDTIFESDAGQNGANLFVRSFNADTTVTFNSTQHFNALYVQGDSNAVLAPSHIQPPYAPGNRYIFTHELRVQAQVDSSLDLTDGALIVNYGVGANRTAPMAKLLAHGINLSGSEGSGRVWDGHGLKSSTARDDPSGLTALGVIDNADIGYTTIGPNNQFGFGVPGVDGDAVPLNSTLVKYTYVGDTDLNGRVDGDDLVAFLVGYQNHLSLWQNGDFDYSGSIDGDDLTALLVAYQNQAATLGSPNVQPRPVSEPGTAIYAFIGVVGMAVVRYAIVRRAASSPL